MKTRRIEIERFRQRMRLKMKQNKKEVVLVKDDDNKPDYEDETVSEGVNEPSLKPELLYNKIRKTNLQLY